jgi:hypothetical protein
VTQVPPVLTQSVHAATDAWRVGTPTRPAAQQSHRTRLPHVRNNLPPASVTDPTRSGASTGRSGTVTATTQGVRHTLQHLTSGLTDRRQHDLGSTVTDTTGNLLDAVGQTGNAVGGALGATVNGVTSEVPSALPGLP